MEEEAERKRHWSTGEKATALALVLFLGIFVTFFGVVIYASSSQPRFCGSFGTMPCPGREDLSIISSTLNSPTNITIQIINTGSVQISLMSYYVKNANGQVYANSTWSGPTLPANAITPVNILIDGTAFTFQARYTYNVIVITSTYQFQFTIQA